MALHPCPRCDRHVLHSETSCPFCGESLPTMSAESAFVPRMSRAAMVLSAAVALGAMQGCERTTPSPAPISNPPNPQPNINDPNAVAAVYGAPPIEDSGVAQQQPSDPAVADAAAADPGPAGPAAIYGGPPPNLVRPSHNMPMTTRYGAPAWVDDIA